MSIRIGERSVTRNLADLSQDFFVRTELNQDWALQLGELVEAGVELKPIFITRDGKVVDGRHRVEGHQLAKKTEIKAKIVEADSDVELVVFALRENLGGSLPPSKGDIEHTIQELLNRGVSKKELEGTLSMLPGKIVRKYLKDVESQMKRVKLQKAALAVTGGGLSVPKAADQYQVPEDDLKALLGGKVKARSKRGVEETKRQLSTAYKSLGQRNRAALNRLFEAYQDGDVSVKQIDKIFSHLEHLIKVSTRKVADWRKRFEAMEAPKKIA